MKHYRINRITENFETVYNLDSRTGVYKDKEGHLLHPMNLICNSDFQISSITDNQRKLTFEINDIVTNSEKEILTVRYIYYQTTKEGSYEVIIETTSNEGHKMNRIEELTPYNKEEVMKVEKDKKKIKEKIVGKDPIEVLEAKIIANFKGRTLKFGESNEGKKFIRKKEEAKDDFIRKFFERNKEFNTIHVDNNTLQTKRDCRRSLGDIFMILKYYYPKCTLESILPYFYGNAEQQIKGLYSQYCFATNKRVFRYNVKPMELHPESADEYGNLPNYYKNLIDF